MNTGAMNNSHARFIFITILLLLLLAVVASAVVETAVSEINRSEMALQLITTEQAVEDTPVVAQQTMADDQDAQLLFVFVGSGEPWDYDGLYGNFWSGRY